MNKPKLDAKLLWQCHRGMLELDLMLQNFVHKQYNNLDARQAIVLQNLLQQPDPILLSWLLGHSSPDDEQLSQMVVLIRKAQQDTLK